MKTFAILTAVTITLMSGTTSSFALQETDRAVGAGSYIHATGPERGVWSSEDRGAR